MAQNETWLNHDLMSAVKVRYLDGNLFSMDNAGNLIGVILTKNGADYSGGGSISANVIRADGGTVAVSGALSGNKATIVLPQAAYYVPGLVSVVVKLTVNGEITTIAAVVANVYQSSTDTAIDPGIIIPSISALIADIDAAVDSIPLDYSALTSAVGFDEYLLNAGKYTVPKSDLEPGVWNYSAKSANSARGRSKYLFPVRSGMIVKYSSTTYDVYFGVLQTQVSNSYLQYSGWVNGTDEYAITHDGYMTFNIRNHADTSATVDVSEFDGTVSIETDQYGLIMRSGSTTLITTNEQATNIFGANANNAPVNTIIGIGQAGLSISNLPLGSSYMNGNLLTYGFRKGLQNGINQIYIGYYGRMFVRSYANSTWQSWKEFAKSDEVSFLPTSTMVTSDEIANTMFGKDFDNLSPNKVYCIGSNGLNISNTPYSGFVGSVMSMNFRETSALAGRMQIAISNSNKLYTRIHFGGSWKPWQQYKQEETVYYVGSTRTNTSLVGLLKTIQTDTSPKVIYMDEGEYDIFQEYKDNEIPSPPSGVQSADYFDYNVFLPKNTRLVGIGNVVLKWNPSTSDITTDEGKTWSPLNLWYGNNTVENITILCKNCRYGIHDDSHNAYTGFTNKYKNVRVIYTESDSGYGFNNTIGFGFEDKCVYEFEDCLFQYIGTGTSSAFYGHDGQYGGASILVKNCVILGGSDNNARSIRLQSLRTDDSNRILTLFSNCHVQGGIRLNQYNSSAGQFFDVTLLHSGNPAQTIDVGDSNPYPIKVYP